MPPLEFLEVARVWQRSASEAERRSAISRAYYAVYHWLRGELGRRRVPLRSTPDEHGRLVSLLEATRSRLALDCARRLRALRELRNVADYELSKPVTVPPATLAIQRANELVRLATQASPADWEQLVSRIAALR